jgi:lambda family phage tail tape measure protein
MTDVVGLRFVATGAREAEAALERHRARLEQAAVAMRAVVAQSNTQTASLARVTREVQKAERETTLLAQAQAQGRITGAQFTGEMNKLAARLRSLGVDRAQAEVMRFARAQSEAARSAEVLARAQQRQTATQTTLTNSTRAAETMTGRIRAQFLATANSIAILDGPLGGVASRFSAFGVLIGRTGLIVGGLLVTLATLGTVLFRGFRSFVEFEAQTARMEAVLRTTGNQAGLTGEQVASMASRIALSTLESEQAVRSAATALLTFRDISGQVFEDVLRSAADLAALGFGTIESETRRLARSLEDPAQALTGLSRAGIVFTRQQRSVIISLVESGQRAEAMERILDNVRRRTQGAAEAAASGTLAGAFDTIGQAVGRATRNFADFITRITGVQAVIRGVAWTLEGLAEGEVSAQVRLERALRARAALLQGLRVMREAPSGTPGAGERSQADQEAAIARQDAEIENLRALVRLDQLRVAIASARQQIERDTTSLDSIQTELDLRRSVIGLTEAQARARRMLAQEGLLDVDIQQRVARVQDALAGASLRERIRLRLELISYRDALAEVQTLEEQIVATLEREQAIRSAQARSSQIADETQLLEHQIILLMRGRSVEEARIQAGAAIEQQRITALLNTATLTEREREILTTLRQQLRVLAAQQAEYDRLAEQARQRAEVEGRLTSLDSENDLLVEQIRLLEQGIEYTEALRQAEINLELARAQTLVTTGAITDEMYEQLKAALLLQGELVTRRDSFRPARGGGRSREVETLEDMIANMERQIEQETRLLYLRGQERRAMEIAFDLQERLRRSGQTYTEDAVRQAAERIAALEAERDRVRAIQDQMAQLGQVMETAISGAITSLVDGTKTAGEAFRDMARAIIAELFRVLVVQQLVGNFSVGGGGILGALAGSGFSQRMFPAANGAVVANLNSPPGANVIPFARGGVVGSPTLFPMTGNRTGLMGEAGPEAIMPLKRGRDGKLGVQAEGGGSVIVNNHFHVSANGDESVKRIVAQQVPAIAEATKAAVIDARRRGGTMKQAFR